MHTTTVYLICFQPGIPRGARPGNASHYLGSASYPDSADRLHEHLTGAGAMTGSQRMRPSSWLLSRPIVGSRRSQR
jgi:hypothetical protein